MHDLLGRGCGNRVLELLAMILNTFVRQLITEWTLTREVEALFIEAVDCVLSGDGALARRKMTTYLNIATHSAQN